jgi:hypothetical protein
LAAFPRLRFGTLVLIAIELVGHELGKATERPMTIQGGRDVSEHTKTDANPASAGLSENVGDAPSKARHRDCYRQPDRQGVRREPNIREVAP